MSPIQVASNLSWDCKTNGHMIALRLKWDFDAVLVTPFCEVCHMMMLPSSSMVGPQADWLMKQVDRARFAPDAPPEAYEGMYS